MWRSGDICRSIEKLEQKAPDVGHPDVRGFYICLSQSLILFLNKQSLFESGCGCFAPCLLTVPEAEKYLRFLFRTSRIAVHGKQGQKLPSQHPETDFERSIFTAYVSISFVKLNVIPFYPTNFYCPRYMTKSIFFKLPDSFRSSTGVFLFLFSTGNPDGFLHR